MSPADTDETTERIRAAALRLFAERGYGNTTIEHISTAADVGVATLYRRWPDKAAIANELYGSGLDSMEPILTDPDGDDPHDQFISVWGRAWAWATDNRELFVFINASAGAPWLSPDNVTRKAALSLAETSMYARLCGDASPDFAAALIGGTIGSVLATEPDIDPDEVAERLWRALNLGSR